MNTLTKQERLEKIMYVCKTEQEKIEKMKLQTKKQLPLSLSYDHRVINGVYALKFLTKLMQYLDDVKFLESSFK